MPSLSTILSSNSSDTLSIQCKSSITMITGEQTAACLQQLLQKFARPQTDQHAIETRQCDVRDLESEQVEQEPAIARRLKAECRQSHFQLLRNISLCLARANPERACARLR